jgi:dienelactone hydrolase
LSLAVERGGAVIAAQTVQLKAYRDDIEIEAVEAKDAGISGSFAYPTGASRLPALVLLHGSEGAIRDASRRWAARMAQQGYAAFALHYVAYGWNDGGIDGVSPYFADVPLDLIEKTRAFLASRPEADAERFGVLGVSKGAEFALSAAAREPFIDAVVACVPSDVVWAGFGREVAPGEEISSWSWRGVPLKAIQYDRYEDVFSGAATATEVHRRSRAKAGAEVVAAAAIPAEAVTARTLLIGGGEDETWPSAEMAQAVEARMAAAGRGDRVTTLVFPEAGHGICGTGAAPERINGEANAAANARANAKSYRATREFLKRVLSR